MTWEDIRPFFYALLIVIGAGLLLFALFLAIAVHRLKKIKLPEDAGFLETLSVTPLSLVIALDLLDLSLDIFAAPLTWVILDRLGLKGLRKFSVVEALIPFTQAVPTMTLSWLMVRFLSDRKLRLPVRKPPGRRMR